MLVGTKYLLLGILRPGKIGSPRPLMKIPRLHTAGFFPCLVFFESLLLAGCREVSCEHLFLSLLRAISLFPSLTFVYSLSEGFHYLISAWKRHSKNTTSTTITRI